MAIAQSDNKPSKVFAKLAMAIDVHIETWQWPIMKKPVDEPSACNIGS